MVIENAHGFSSGQPAVLLAGKLSKGSKVNFYVVYALTFKENVQSMPLTDSLSKCSLLVKPIYYVGFPPGK